MDNKKNRKIAHGKLIQFTARAPKTLSIHLISPLKWHQQYQSKRIARGKLIQFTARALMTLSILLIFPLNPFRKIKKLINLFLATQINRIIIQLIEIRPRKFWKF